MVTSALIALAINLVALVVVIGVAVSVDGLLVPLLSIPVILTLLFYGALNTARVVMILRGRNFAKLY